MTTDRSTAIAFAGNLSRLMAKQGLSQAELARKTGIGQRTLSTLLNLESPLDMNPRSTTVEQVAAYFKVAAWMLLIPDMPIDLLESDRVARLISSYSALPEDARQTVERVAEAQAHYAGAPKKHGA